jgi:hypothetical protein
VSRNPGFELADLRRARREKDIAAGDEGLHAVKPKLLKERHEPAHGHAPFAQIDPAQKGDVSLPSFRIHFPASIGEVFFVEPAERIFFVFAKRRNIPKPGAFVQADGGRLINAGFQPQQADALASRKVRQVIQQQPAKAQTAKWWADVHPFEFAVIGAKELNAPHPAGVPVSRMTKKATPCAINFSTL